MINVTWLTSYFMNTKKIIATNPKILVKPKRTGQATYTTSDSTHTSGIFNKVIQYIT